MHEHLDFGWLYAFRTNYPIFKRLRDEQGRPDLKFQVGLPTGIGIAFSMLSPLDALRYASAFDRRMAHEANAILDEADEGDILFQLGRPRRRGLLLRARSARRVDGGAADAGLGRPRELTSLVRAGAIRDSAVADGDGGAARTAILPPEEGS